MWWIFCLCSLVNFVAEFRITIYQSELAKPIFTGKFCCWIQKHNLPVRVGKDWKFQYFKFKWIICLLSWLVNCDKLEFVREFTSVYWQSQFQRKHFCISLLVNCISELSRKHNLPVNLGRKTAKNLNFQNLLVNLSFEFKIKIYQ